MADQAAQTLNLREHAKFHVLQKGVSQGEIILPDDSGYEASIKRWSAASVKRAAVVVKPASAEEASTAVRFATANNISLTVCCGGHSSSGASSSAGGMVIDLSLLRQVEVNSSDMTVSFGGGCLWENIDSALEKQGFATVGGVVNHTGVGGLILGGGHGYLTPLYGLTIDNLISAQVVLADGSIVTASLDDNADLFWALRGAGAQFGIVTRFVSRIFKQGPVWGGVIAYSPDKLKELAAFANEFHTRPSTDGHCLAVGLGFGPDGQSRAVMAIPCFQGTEKDARQYFSGLFYVGFLADNTSMMPISQMNTLLNPLMDHGIRRLMGASNVTMPLDPNALADTAKMFWEFCEDRPGMALSVIAIEFFPTAKIREVSQDATAYANRGELYDTVAVFSSSDKSLDAEIRQFNRELSKQISSTNGLRPGSAGANSSQPVGKYINIESDDIAPQDAFGSNLARLQELKKKFDPHNVFHKWHGVGVAKS